MKIVWDILLLVGLFPGTVLPSSVTEQLIAPASWPIERQSTDQDLDQSRKPENPEEPDAVLGIPSVYSAIRPASFPYTKGDLRTINNQNENSEWYLHGTMGGVAASGIDAPVPLSRADEIISKTRKPALIIPPRRAQAPPCLSSN